MPGRKWTTKQRKEQAEAIHRWRPWEKSTGPRTPKGKERSSQNGIKHGLRSKAVARFRSLDKAFRHSDQEDFDFLGQVEDARGAACEFVAKYFKQGDLDSKVVALEFIHRQIRKAWQRLDFKMAPLVKKAKGR